MSTNDEIKGQNDLEADVIKKDLCTLCGACMGMCPYNVAYQGRPVILENCKLDQGKCYAFCPRTGLDVDIINTILFKAPYPSTPLGTTQQILMARSKDKKVLAKAQYGGVVTTTLLLALKQRQIDSVVLTKSNGNILPSSYLANSPEEIIACAGVNYAAAPTIEALNRFPMEIDPKLAIVGVPCQLQALGKMRALSSNYESNIGKVEFTIGLFCTWALDYEKIFGFLKERIDIKEVKKFDIPPPPANIFQVHTKGELKEYSLDSIREFIRSGCQTCIDMTAEFADISVGAVEGIPGWNTVVVRSDKGRLLIEEAESNGLIETKPIPSENLQHLEEASLNKKRRGLENIVQRTRKKGDFGYLSPSKTKIAGFLKEGY